VSVGAFNSQIIRWGMFVTFRAVEQVSQHSFAPFYRGDPCAIHPRRIMANMLIVATGKLGDPMAFIIRVISGNRLLHWETSRNGTMGFVESRSWQIVTARNAYSAVFEVIGFPGRSPDVDSTP
jgi:hypothetical protein